MGIRLKFNLILCAIFAAGLGMVAVVAERYLTRVAHADAERAALIALDMAVLGNLDTRTASALGSRLVELKLTEFSASVAQSGLDGQMQARLLGHPSNQLIDTLATPTGKHLMIARKISANDGAKIRVADVDLDPCTKTNTLSADRANELGRSCICGDFFCTQHHARSAHHSPGFRNGACR